MHVIFHRYIGSHRISLILYIIILKFLLSWISVDCHQGSRRLYCSSTCPGSLGASAMDGTSVLRLRRSLVRFRKEADSAIPGMDGVQLLISELETCLDSLHIDTVVRVRGKNSIRLSAVQLRRQVYYLTQKQKKLEKQLKVLQGDRSRYLKHYWAVSAGLSDPKSSQRSVQSWCQDWRVGCVVSLVFLSCSNCQVS